LKNNLETLKDLTHRLPLFPEELGYDTNSTHKEYKMEAGSCHGWLIYTNATSVAVHKWYNSANSIFPKHVHDTTEIIVVYEGQMKLYLEDKEVVLNPQDCYFIKSNTEHSAKFDSSCRYITITVPPAPEFPGLDKGGKNG